MSSSNSQDQTYSFGPINIHASHVFATTPLSFAFVNLKPVVPGHVLVSPKRVVKRFADLTADEISDLWTLVQKVGKVVEPQHKATSLTLAIQDGPAAGQTVPTVHVHVLPRKAGDFEKNDDVYDAIDAASKVHSQQGGQQAQQAQQAQQGEHLDLDAERVVRTHDQMAAEASALRALLETP